MKDVFVNIRMTADMKAQIAALAVSEHRSLSGQIALMLQNQLQSVPKIVRPTVRVNTDLPEGVSEQTWIDFKALRNAKKAPLTPRALEGIANQAMKALNDSYA